MIANRGFGRWKGKSSFNDCVAYVTREAAGERPLAVWSEGVASIATAALEMDALASASRVVDPLYHLIVSWGPDERPSLDSVRAALDRQIAGLGFDGLQYVAAVHEDGEAGMWHAHAVFNRVDPYTRRGREIWGDRVAIRDACREVEREDGWRIPNEAGAEVSRGAWSDFRKRDERRKVDGFSQVSSGEKRQRVENEAESDVKRGIGGEFSGGTNAEDRYGVKARFKEWVKVEIAPRVSEIASEAGSTWAHVSDFLDSFALRYEVVVERGARIVGSVSGWGVKLSEIGLRHSDLVSRLGEWVGARVQEARDGIGDLGEQVAAARRVVGNLGSEVGWVGVHAELEKLGLGLERSFNGIRVVALDGPQWQRIERTDEVLSIRSLQDKFGRFESSGTAIRRQEIRAAVKAAENLAVSAQLERDPSPIFTTLLHTKSAVSVGELDREIARRVIDAEQREHVTRAALSEMVALDVAGEVRLTTRGVLEEERNAADAARSLASDRQVRVVRRGAGDHLDDQQRRAYEYTFTPDSRLKVITGVPGSGKTTLLNELAAGFRSAGYAVRGVSVANSAVEVLRKETSIPARSVAKEIFEWSRSDGSDRGRGARAPAAERLTAKDVLFIDEVSTLGTEQGGKLLREAAAVGAIVVALGDDKQFQAVARGDALRLMQEAVGDRTVDLTKTRRQVEPWMRRATEDVRAGDIRSALEAYRRRGAVQEAATQDEARQALISKWVALESDGVETGIETYTNKERIVINAAAREAYRRLGKLEGRDHVLETMDGRVPYAIGDRIVIRETIKPVGLINGSGAVVRGISGSVLSLEKKDGEIVKVDTNAHPGVQHSYCVSEFREQGSTRRAELQFLTRHVNQRSLTVGITRHTHEFAAFYSREEFRGGFNAVVRLGERSQKKALARDGVELGIGIDVVSPSRGVGDRGAGLAR